MTGLWLLTYMAVPTLTAQLSRMPQLEPQTVSLVMLGATAVSALAMAGAGALSSRIGRRRFFVGFGLLCAAVSPSSSWRCCPGPSEPASARCCCWQPRCRSRR